MLIISLLPLENSKRGSPVMTYDRRVEQPSIDRTRDERQQIARLKTERKRLFLATLLSNVLIITGIGAPLISVASAFTSFRFPGGSYAFWVVWIMLVGILMLVLCLALALFLRWLGGKPPVFHCPNSACGDATNALIWRCGECRKEHNPGAVSRLFGYPEPVIGEACVKCRKAPSHF